MRQGKARSTRSGPSRRDLEVREGRIAAIHPASSVIAGPDAQLNAVDGCWSAPCSLPRRGKSTGLPPELPLPKWEEPQPIPLSLLPWRRLVPQQERLQQTPRATAEPGCRRRPVRSDLAANQVLRHGKPEYLTGGEFKVLRYLVTHLSRIGDGRSSSSFWRPLKPPVPQPVPLMPAWQDPVCNAGLSRLFKNNDSPAPPCPLTGSATSRRSPHSRRCVRRRSDHFPGQ